MRRRPTAVALIAIALAAGACGGSAQRTDGDPPAADAAEPPPTGPSASCDAALRRRLEAKLRTQVEKELADEDGIVHGETNSGCAQIRLPSAAGSQR